MSSDNSIIAVLPGFTNSDDPPAVINVEPRVVRTEVYEEVDESL